MSEKNELWAVVEVMGHARYAGMISEHTELGVPLVRVDVPAVGGRPAYTKLLGASSIFRITPCTREAAEAAARQCWQEPLAIAALPVARPAPPPAFLEDDCGDDDDELDYLE